MKTIIALMFLVSMNQVLAAEKEDSRALVLKSPILIQLTEGVEAQHGLKCDPYKVDFIKDQFTASSSCGFIGHDPDEYDLELRIKGNLIGSSVFMESVRFEYDN